MKRLETGRLLLRPWTQEDAADLYEYARDPRVGPVAGWPTHKSEEESREIIRTVFAKPGVFAMELKDSGKVVGSIGFTDSHREELPQPDDELGYCLSPACWGQGLTPEAAREILRYGFEELGLSTIWCNYYEGNEKSKRVIEKCGFPYRFSQDSEVSLLDEVRLTHYHALTREEWRAL